jgi:hypothetical protein
MVRPQPSDFPPPPSIDRPAMATKRNVLGVLVDAVDYDAATARVLAAARERQPFGLTALAVHGVMTGVTDRAYRARLNSLDMVTADGQPVRWALNLLHRAGLISQTRRSRQLIYAAEYGAMTALLAYLTENCCGSGESCAPACDPADAFATGESDEAAARTRVR